MGVFELVKSRCIFKEKFFLVTIVFVLTLRPETNKWRGSSVG